MLKQYLIAVAALSSKSVEAMVLKYGREYPAPAVARPQGMKKGKDKECYTNAYHTVISNKGFTYVEGYATTYGIPLEHAWVLDPNGVVIDPTWRTPGEQYYGIEFDIPFVNQVIHEKGTYGVLDARSSILRNRFGM